MNREAAIALALTVVIAAVVVAYGNRPLYRGGIGEPRVLRYAAPLGDLRELEVDISMGAGVLNVQTIDSANAYEAEIRRNAGLPEVVRYDDGHLRLRDSGPRFRWSGYVNEWTVGVSRRIPLDLDIAAGAGRAAIDLTGASGRAEITAGAGDIRVAVGPGPARLERLELRGGVGRFEALGLGYAEVPVVEVRAGVGEFVLDFTGAARGTTQLDVRGGVGRMLIIAPGMGVRLRVSRGATRRLIVPGFRQVSDDEYVNAAWETAAARLEIRAALGVGELEVRGR